MRRGPARNGKGDAYAYCKRCRPGAIVRQWTRERVREAMRAWRPRYGAAALKRLQTGEWPAASTVIDLYGVPRVPARQAQFDLLANVAGVLGAPILHWAEGSLREGVCLAFLARTGDVHRFG